MAKGKILNELKKRIVRDAPSFNQAEYDRLMAISMNPKYSSNERNAADRLLARMKPQH